MIDKDKILVVEDERDTRFILEKLLTKNNFEVMTANNGQEALVAVSYTHLTLPTSDLV